MFKTDALQPISILCSRGTLTLDAYNTLYITILLAAPLSPAHNVCV